MTKTEMRKETARLEQELYALVDKAADQDPVRTPRYKEWTKNEIHSAIMRIRTLWEPM